MSYNKNSLIIEDRDTIEDFLAHISTTMSKYVAEHKNSKFVMFYKTLMHADLITSGKAMHVGDYKKNLLYYIDESEMKSIEEFTGKVMETTHQSNIGLKKSLYEKVGLMEPRGTDTYLINDIMDVKLVNETLVFLIIFIQKTFLKNWVKKQIINLKKIYASAQILYLLISNFILQDMELALQKMLNFISFDIICLKEIQLHYYLN